MEKSRSGLTVLYGPACQSMWGWAASCMAWESKSACPLFSLVLDDAWKAVTLPLSLTCRVAQALELSSQLDGRYSRRTMLSLAQYDENEVPLEVIIDLVKHIDLYMEEGAILIFLSGWEEISVVREREAQSVRGARLSCLK